MYFGVTIPKRSKDQKMLLRAAACAVLFSGLTAAAVAQGHPPPPPPPVASGPSSAAPTGSGDRRGGRGAGAPQASAQLGPSGRWWDNNGVAKSIGLKTEQRQRMDSVFNANKAALFNTYRTLKSEETKLDALKRAESPEEDKILVQIDKVSSLRGQLEKQSASLSLQLRKELRPEQIKQLESAP